MIKDTKGTRTVVLCPHIAEKFKHDKLIKDKVDSNSLDIVHKQQK